MSLEFVKSEKGQIRLLLNGFLYHKDSYYMNTDSTYWRCIHQREKHCTGRVITSQDKIVKIVDHNHSAEASFIVKEKVVENLKHSALNTTLSSHKLISNVAADMSDSVIALMPSTSSLKRTLRNIRHENENHPSNPLHRKDFILPQYFCETEKKADFLLYDKGAVENRMLIFGTQENLQLLASAEHWYADGTFDSCPSIFAQLYTIHANIENRIVPLVYALLPGKSEVVYREMLDQLINIQADLSPSTVLIDMERAAVQAFLGTFPDVSIRFCNFHFNQSVYRKVMTYNLKSVYDTDEIFAKKIKLLAALAFVPIDNVENLFDRIVDEVFQNPEKDEENFLFSFEEQFIGRVDRRGNRRPANFPIEY
ncbi:uncharacterized protein [Venturia canescens]|uniref:uncharacterized protein n=1 Tax=Venturia canescens TaxID=32260 RepID=UPI001C9C83DD|nr:uncharacterized protein LOC122406329 [Venturia canescens]